MQKNLRYDIINSIKIYFRFLRGFVLATSKSSNYYVERNNHNLIAINELLNKDLPEFCGDYFLGIDSQTSTLTRLNYAHDLKIFFHFLMTKRFKSYSSVKQFALEDLESITNNDIEMFLAFLSNYTFQGKLHVCNERAKARKLSSVRAMFKYFFNRGMISVDNSAKVATPKLHEKPIIRLDKDEIFNIVDVTESGEGLSPHQRVFHERNKVRDSAIIILFLGTGIRISELVGLNNEDINFNDNSFVVTRKGGNKSILFFDDDVASAINRYMDYKQECDLPADAKDALFLSSQKRRITVRAVENLVQKYAKIVSPLKKISPHKLRSTYGTALYKATGDIYVVADVLGHKDVNTTRKHYAAISEDTRRSVVGKVKLHPDDDAN